MTHKTLMITLMLLIISCESWFHFKTQVETEECSCEGEMKTCIFFHGAGVSVNESTILESYPVYWGNDLVSLPCCASMKFSRINTMNVPWFDESLQDEYCATLLSLNDNDSLEEDDDTIPNVIVITHSMASLVLSLALANEKCQLDSGSSKWVSLQAPMMGTPVADAITDLCQSNDQISSFQVCNNSDSSFSSFQNLASFVEPNGAFGSRELRQQYALAQDQYKRRVDAALCGTSAFGLPTVTDSFKYLALTEFLSAISNPDIWAQGQVLHDGIVPASSCIATIEADDFHPSYTSRFYLAKINHADGTFRHGNGGLSPSWAPDQQPLRWLKCLF